MRTRMTYLPSDVADQFADFIMMRDEEVFGTVKARTTDYGILSILKFLYPLLGSSLTFTELYRESKIRMKRSFLRYMKLCIEYDFVRKINAESSVRYHITDRGRTILDLFMQKNI